MLVYLITKEINRKEKRKMEQPTGITICLLECLVMPNGEVISAGKTLGWFRDFGDYLTEQEEPERRGDEN